MSSITFTPTTEQTNILSAVSTCKNLVIQAGAGTGKTATLEMIAREIYSQGRSGIYLTLNKSIATEVGSRFAQYNVTASTIHALCYKISTAHPYIAPLINKLNSERSSSRYKLAKDLRFAGTFTYTSYRTHNTHRAGGARRDDIIDPKHMIYAALDALSKWCQGSTDRICVTDIACPCGMPEDVYSKEFAPQIVDLAIRLWEDDILNPDGLIPFSHDYYLKLVSMLKPRIDAFLGLPQGSVLLYDEAQDVRPSMTEIIKAQTSMQTICVGDSAQAIYRFTGAVDALPIFSALPETQTLTLTTSWRFGKHIADYANHLLGLLNAPIRLSGNPELSSTVTTYPEASPPNTDAVLVRTNEMLIKEALLERSKGRKIAIVADISRILDVLADIDRLMLGQQPHAVELRDFISIDELKDFINDSNGNQDSGIDAVIPIALRMGTTAVRTAITDTYLEVDADVVLTTAHKAKGRQWDSVRIAMSPSEIIPGYLDVHGVEVDITRGVFTPESLDALMLLYVSITRARRALHIPQETHDALCDIELSTINYLS